MSLFAFVLLSQAVSPQAVIDRYTEYRKANPAISVDWSFSNGDVAVGSGTLTVGAHRRLLFKASHAGEAYSLSETELGGVELLPAETLYDELPPQNFLYVPGSRISGASRLVPFLLLQDKINFGKAKLVSDGSATINGESVDLVSWTVQTQAGEMHILVGIDAQGRLIKFVRQLSGGPAGAPNRRSPQSPTTAPLPSSPQTNGSRPGSEGPTWIISNYQSAANKTLASFLTPIPKGFVPFAIPASSEPNISVDQTFPTVAWKAKISPITPGKVTLLVFTAPDCAPSAKALTDLGLIKADAVGAQVRAISLASEPAAAKALGETSTPLFVLLDESGKITNLWTGYDHEHSIEFGKELRKAVKDLSSK